MALADDLYGGLGALVGDKATLFPWLASLTQQLAYLKSIAVPANLSPALQSLIKGGDLIVSQVAAGTTVSSDDAKQWLYQTQIFAKHLSAALAAPLAQTAIAGQSTPDDSDIFSGVSNVPADLWGEIQSVLAEIEGELQKLATPVIGILAIAILGTWLLAEIMN